MLPPKPESVTCHELPTPFNIPIYFTGPPLSEGPLPALFYFCATAQESLCVDPYNQPVSFLRPFPLRVFSMTLPFHTLGADNRRSVGLWAEQYSLGNDPLEPFFEVASHLLDYLVEVGIAKSMAIATGGLSRGALIATHLAARSPHVHSVVGFAPLTDLFCLEEFEPMRDNPFVIATTLIQIAETLIGKPLRFYIGNRDSRVGTDACYNFVRHLTDLSYNKGKRSPLVELILSPSIGHMGHGTSPETFLLGARWIAQTLGLTAKN